MGTGQFSSLREAASMNFLLHWYIAAAATGLGDKKQNLPPQQRTTP
jgi:hypothetical protein